jgi:hypothetical protein
VCFLISGLRYKETFVRFLISGECSFVTWERLLIAGCGRVGVGWGGGVVWGVWV